MQRPDGRVAERRHLRRSTESPHPAEVVLFLPVVSSTTKVLNRQISQEVCPHNSRKFVQITSEEAFWPRAGAHGERLIELMRMSQEEFSRRFKNSPVKRAKRRGLLRNVAVALGNWGSPEAVRVLAKTLGDEEPRIRPLLVQTGLRPSPGATVETKRISDSER
jgi:hypothetical protein